MLYPPLSDRRRLAIGWVVAVSGLLLAGDLGLNAGETVSSEAATPEPTTPYRIELVDEQTGWPVPLVTLRTTHQMRWVSDNAGVIAIDAPELIDREVYFSIDGAGYEIAPDGFGYRGVRVTPQPGGVRRIELSRRLPAERIGRMTGGGIFAHSQRLGAHTDWIESGVFGCDSIQLAKHRDRLFWVWGDTTLPHYPLGVFHATAATTPVGRPASLTPPWDMNYDYIRGPDGRPRGVAKMPGSGPTWLSGMVSLPDRDGQSHLVASYAKINPPLSVYEYGLCEWNESSRQFDQLAVVWRKDEQHPDPPPVPRGHAVFWENSQDNRWVLFGDPFPTLKCPARYEDWRRPETWQELTPQTSVATKLDEPAMVEPHSGSIGWHPWRDRWVTVFMQRFGKPSAFGELWYAEADSPLGPWGSAVKILSHDDYTFYNPRVHHEWFDAASPDLYFEGTYTRQFSGSRTGTPRHDYNQVLYRLALDDQRLRPAAESPNSDSTTEADSAADLPAVRVSDDGTHFVAGEDDQRFVVWGVNYDHDSDGQLLEEYWWDQWSEVVEDFREIKALGANCVRIHLQFGSFMESPDTPRTRELNRLKKLLELAEHTGLYLDITGLACYHQQNIPAWYDELDEESRWDAQAVFWESIARTCHNSSAVFCYDLMNEPILPGNQVEQDWLTGELGGKFFVQRIALDRRGRTRPQIAKAWVNKMSTAIRRHDAEHMITVGVIPWVFVFGGGKPLFHSPEVGEKLDFVAVHFYPEKGEVDAAVAALDAYEIGKPLIVEEMFPLKCGIDELESFIRRSAKHCDGWISFYWGTPASELKAKSDKSIGEAITAQWLEKFKQLSREKNSLHESATSDKSP